MGNWKLQLMLVGPCGERYAISISVAEEVASDIAKINPPSMLAPFERSLDQTVSVLRRREFRKDLLMQECTRLGKLLSERMEDAEGWHDASRIEPAKRQLETL